MTTTITHATGTVVPTALEGYRASRPARTLVHRILNRADDDVTLREFGLRSGSFVLVFDGEAAAVAAFAALGVPQKLAITDTAVHSLAMSFVIAEGELSIEQDRDNVRLWRVTVPYNEVTA
ncbi:hypothetical protein [Microbacterium sp. GCS4]|uniref:hypothetical protein n=1 Tax=Microbacterium sp. GCS4 TaxID=1692239 RepID=UPI000680A4F2|nr:hypothetical protein [Microbacterium sp. GCS4]KNY07915.1 hypothetical protein AKH00_06775 [Microbacterium sp. GCS4]